MDKLKFFLSSNDSSNDQEIREKLSKGLRSVHESLVKLEQDNNRTRTSLGETAKSLKYKSKNYEDSKKDVEKLLRGRLRRNQEKINEIENFLKCQEALVRNAQHDRKKLQDKLLKVKNQEEENE